MQLELSKSDVLLNEKNITKKLINNTANRFLMQAKGLNYQTNLVRTFRKLPIQL